MNHPHLTALLLAILPALPIQLPAADTLQNNTGMTFQKIPAGEFIMGSADLDEVIIEQPDGKAAMVKDETPAHRVVFEQPFYLGTTEVTQAQWFTVMNTKPGPDSGWSHKNWQQHRSVTGSAGVHVQAPLRQLDWYSSPSQGRPKSLKISAISSAERPILI